MAKLAGPPPRGLGVSRTTVFLATLGIVLLALFLPGWYGAILLVGVVAGLLALLRVTWPGQPPAARLLRLLAIAALLAAAITKIVN